MTPDVVRAVIVNADDFGASAGVNRGIVEAHVHGIVTSASLMVRGPAAAEAAALGKEHPALSIGLHIDIAEWTFENGSWRRVYMVADQSDRDAMADELGRQLESFHRLTGAEPTHLDSHQHAHRDEPLSGLVAAAGVRLGIPVRERATIIRYRGDFHGQDTRGAPLPEAITATALVALLRSLAPGVTELGCHPGFADDLHSSYRVERALEVRALCDAGVRAALHEERIDLRSFRIPVRLPEAASDHVGPALS